MNPTTAVYNDAFNDALVLGVGTLFSTVKPMFSKKKGLKLPLFRCFWVRFFL